MLGALHSVLSKLILRARMILRQLANTGKEQKHLKTWESTELHSQEVGDFGNSFLELASKFYIIMGTVQPAEAYLRLC